MLEEMRDDDENAESSVDSWAQTLAHLAKLQAANKSKAMEQSGRGVRRKAAQIKVRQRSDKAFVC